MNRQEIMTLLRAVQADLPSHEPADSQLVFVPAVLVKLAAAWPGPLTEPHRQQIEKLCLKIGASPTVLQAYEAGWAKPRNGQPLAAAYWPVLLAVLLAWSETPDEMGPDGLGLSLKCLNAALAAYDHIEAMSSANAASIGSTGGSPLRSWLDSRLATVSCEVGR